MMHYGGQGYGGLPPHPSGPPPVPPTNPPLPPDNPPPPPPEELSDGSRKPDPQQGYPWGPPGPQWHGSNYGSYTQGPPPTSNWSQSENPQWTSQYGSSGNNWPAGNAPSDWNQYYGGQQGNPPQNMNQGMGSDSHGRKPELEFDESKDPELIEFDQQFKSWEEKFQNWREENKSHPDKAALAKYEETWTKWRDELLQKRNDIKKNKLDALRATKETENQANKGWTASPHTQMLGGHMSRMPGGPPTVPAGGQPDQTYGSSVPTSNPPISGPPHSQPVQTHGPPGGPPHGLPGASPHGPPGGPPHGPPGAPPHGPPGAPPHGPPGAPQHAPPVALPHGQPGGPLQGPPGAPPHLPPGALPHGPPGGPPHMPPGGPPHGPHGGPPHGPPGGPSLGLPGGPPQGPPGGPPQGPPGGPPLGPPGGPPLGPPGGPSQGPPGGPSQGPPGGPPPQGWKTGSYNQGPSWGPNSNQTRSNQGPGWNLNTKSGDSNQGPGNWSSSGPNQWNIANQDKPSNQYGSGPNQVNPGNNQPPGFAASHYGQGNSGPDPTQSQGFGMSPNQGPGAGASQGSGFSPNLGQQRFGNNQGPGSGYGQGPPQVSGPGHNFNDGAFQKGPEGSWRNDNQTFDPNQGPPNINRPYNVNQPPNEHSKRWNTGPNTWQSGGPQDSQYGSSSGANFSNQGPPSFQGQGSTYGPGQGSGFGPNQRGNSGSQDQMRGPNQFSSGPPGPGPLRGGPRGSPFNPNENPNFRGPQVNQSSMGNRGGSCPPQGWNPNDGPPHEGWNQNQGPRWGDVNPPQNMPPGMQNENSNKSWGSDSQGWSQNQWSAPAPNQGAPWNKGPNPDSYDQGSNSSPGWGPDGGPNQGPMGRPNWGVEDARQDHPGMKENQNPGWNYADSSMGGPPPFGANTSEDSPPTWKSGPGYADLKDFGSSRGRSKRGRGKMDKFKEEILSTEISAWEEVKHFDSFVVYEGDSLTVAASKPPPKSKPQPPPKMPSEPKEAIAEREEEESKFSAQAVSRATGNVLSLFKQRAIDGSGSIPGLDLPAKEVEKPKVKPETKPAKTPPKKDIPSQDKTEGRLNIGPIGVTREPAQSWKPPQDWYDDDEDNDGGDNQGQNGQDGDKQGPLSGNKKKRGKNSSFEGPAMKMLKKTREEQDCGPPSLFACDFESFDGPPGQFGPGPMGRGGPRGMRPPRGRGLNGPRGMGPRGPGPGPMDSEFTENMHPGHMMGPGGPRMMGPGGPRGPRWRGPFNQGRGKALLGDGPRMGPPGMDMGPPGPGMGPGPFHQGRGGPNPFFGPGRGGPMRGRGFPGRGRGRGFPDQGPFMQDEHAGPFFELGASEDKLYNPSPAQLGEPPDFDSRRREESPKVVDYMHSTALKRFNENEDMREESSFHQDKDLRKEPCQDSPESDSEPQPEVVAIDDLIAIPGRFMRPPKLVIILRGLPGSGKSTMARMIKDKEIENGGSAPRILCLDDYFMVEVEKMLTDSDSGRKVKTKVMEYEYEPELEDKYRAALVKSFKKQVDEKFFPFIIIDCINNRYSHYKEICEFAKKNDFEPYIVELDVDVQVSFARNTRNRTLADIQSIASSWEPTPPSFTRLDLTTYIQDADIQEVEMEDCAVKDEDQSDTPIEVSPAKSKRQLGKEAAEESPNSEKKDEEEEDDDGGAERFKIINELMKSKWDTVETQGEKLDKLDGIKSAKKRRGESNPQSIEDWLQLSKDYDNRKDLPGKKRVRWADMEERKRQLSARDRGFVFGQTDWQRMTDPSLGSNALVQVHYIE